MPKKTSLATRAEIARIYKFIEENKHKHPHGITNSLMFASVVTKVDDPQQYYSQPIKIGEVDYSRYTQKIARYRKRGYLKFEAPSPGEPRQWSVAEEFLPAGTVTYTGVHNSPLANFSAPKPKPPVVLPPAQAVDKEKLRQEGIEFVEEQLKELWVNGAQLEHKYGVASFKRVSLYTLYKAAVALEIDQRAITKSKEAPIADEAEGEGKPF